MNSTQNTKTYYAKAFVFDLDGTLIDTTALVEHFLASIRSGEQFRREKGTLLHLF